jgi:VWA domain-containing protein
MRPVSLFAMLVALSPTLVPEASAADIDPRDEVLKILDAQPLRTDFVVLLDTSGSMGKHFDAARKFVAELARLAKPGDTIHFIAFNERAGELTVTVRQWGSSAVESALANVKQPHGQFTDLGQGFDAAFDVLIRPGYAPLSMVFLITDFCHEPPPQSPYEGDLDGQGPCRHVRLTDAIKKKAQTVFAAGDQQVRAVALAIEPTNEPGFDAARELFGSVVRVDVAGNALVQSLDTLRKKVAYDRAALQIEGLLKRPPFTLTSASDPLPIQGAAIADMKLTSSSPIPIRLEPKSMRAVDGTARFMLPAFASPLDLPPLRTEKSKEPPKAEPVSLPVKAENLPKRARRWSPTNPFREIEIELVTEYELSPKEGIEKLIGRTPRAEAKLQQRVRFDLSPIESASPLLLQPADGKTRISLGANETMEVPLLLTSTVAWADVQADCTIAGEKREPVTIAPEESAPLKVVLRNEALSDRWRLAQELTREIEIKGDCDVLAIAGDGSKIPGGRHPVALTFTIFWREGYALSLVIGILAALVLAILIYVYEIRPRLEPPILTGRLVIYDGPGDFQRVTMPLVGKTRVCLQAVALQDGTTAHIDGDRIVLPGSDTSAEIYAEKFGKKSVIRLRKLEGDGVMFGESKIGAAPVDLRKGRSRFSVGNYHCRIE